MKDIAIYGFGGFGREVACLIAEINRQKPTWHLVGYFDDEQLINTKNRYGRVLGGMEELNAWPMELAVALAIGNGKVVERLVAQIVNPHIYFPNIIASNVSYFDPHTITMGRGNIITFGSRLSCDVHLGNFNILNGCISLGHDVQIGDFNVLFTDTRISGETTIGNRNFFGARSFIAQRLKIGSDTRIGAGSIVLRNTKDGNLYMGNPALKINI